MSAYLGSTKIWDSSSTPSPAEWVRPADWLAMPTIAPTEEKLVGLHCVWPTDGNFCAFTISGAFTVDWGDGVVENFASGATAYHEYDYDDVDLAGTESTRGYKQVLVTITPQSGKNLTSVNFHVKHNQAGLLSGYSSGWLDIMFSAPSCTNLIIGGTTSRHSMFERFTGLSCGLLTSMSYMFNNCYSLASLDLSSFDTSAVTSISMFSSCYSLASLLFPCDKTFTVASCKLSAAALDELYTSLPTVTGKTITVTGNYGTSGHTPSIATAKSWTVTF